MSKLKDIVALCRPQHWIKNLLVLTPLFFVGSIFDLRRIGDWGIAIGAFCLVASAVYALNDALDATADAAHPVKCRRPVAAGRISRAAAVALALLLAAGAVGCLAAAGRAFSVAMALLVAYLLMNVLYSLFFKHAPLIDVFVLSLGFVLRVFYGGAYFSIQISSLLFLCVFCTAMFLGFGKRRVELERLGTESATRPALRRYSVRFLEMHYYLFLALGIVFYSLWTIERCGGHFAGWLTLTIPLMIFLVTRYSLLIETRKGSGDPLPMLFSDPVLVVGALLFVLANVYCLYFHACPFGGAGV